MNGKKSLIDSGTRACLRRAAIRRSFQRTFRCLGLGSLAEMASYVGSRACQKCHRSSINARRRLRWPTWLAIRTSTPTLSRPICHDRTPRVISTKMLNGATTMKSAPSIQTTCPRCKQIFPRTSEFFGVDPSSKDDFRSYCKRCARAYDDAYQADQREEVVARKAACMRLIVSGMQLRTLHGVPPTVNRYLLGMRLTAKNKGGAPSAHRAAHRDE
jgi:hypothetical protein